MVKQLSVPVFKHVTEFSENTSVLHKTLVFSRNTCLCVLSENAHYVFGVVSV